MSSSDKSQRAQTKAKISRRGLVKCGGGLLAAYTVGKARIPQVYAAEDNTIRLALVGAGGRGTGAVANALATKMQGPIKLYTVADLYKDNLDGRLKSLKDQFGDQVEVSEERKFLGFDSHKHAIDMLRPGDIALCTTRAYIRPAHVEYAVKRGVNVFMEKPFAPDPGGLRRMLRVVEEAEKKGVKIAAGLQCRHSPARAALIDKINGGELGEISYIRANRLTGRRWLEDQGENSNVLVDQLQFGKSHLYWVGSGHMVDNLIHQIDECCWLMDDWPVSCHGMGAREVGSDDHGQNNDTYSMEYTFPNGKKAFCGFRRALGGHTEFATFAHCTKRAAQFSGQTHQATVHMFKDQRISEDNIAWSPTADTHSPWDYEWIDFIDSIRNNKPHNEGKRAVYADYAALMGRAAAHLNRVVTWEEVIGSDFQFCDYLDELDYDSPPPVKADDEGYFPAPVAGEWKEL